MAEIVLFMKVVRVTKAVKAQSSSDSNGLRIQCENGGEKNLIVQIKSRTVCDTYLTDSSFIYGEPLFWALWKLVSIV